MVGDVSPATQQQLSFHMDLGRTLAELHIDHIYTPNMTSSVDGRRQGECGHVPPAKSYARGSW